MQQKNQYGLLEYIYNASTGKMLWTNYSKTSELIDVGRGNVGDVDPRHDGFACWSFQGLYNMNGKKMRSMVFVIMSRRLRGCRFMLFLKAEEDKRNARREPGVSLECFRFRFAVLWGINDLG